MNKEELLQELSAKISSGEISREDVVSWLNSVAPMTQRLDDKETKRPLFSVTKMLYFLGAAIVIIGIVIFATQIWDYVGSFVHIMVTLGLGLLMTAIGSMLLKQKLGDNIGSIFHFIGGMLVPCGAVIALSELSVDGDWMVAITFVGIFAFYMFLNALHKHTVLTFFAIVNGTIAIYLILNAIVGGPFKRWEWFDIKNVYQYLTMAIGVSYLLLAHAFRGGWNKKLIGALYFFGSAGFLGAAFSQVFDSVSWQLLYFLFVIGGFFLSVYMKSRSILVMSTLFLLTHVSFITGKYFADSFGWPISLVVLGFVFIGLGYASVNINKKYIKEVR